MNVDSFTFDFPEPPPDPVYLLTLQVEQLTRELNESRAQVALSEHERRQENQKWSSEHDNANRIILSLTEKLSSQQIATRNACAGQVKALRALRLLRDIIMSDALQPDQKRWPGEVFQAVNVADDTLNELDIPF